MRRRQFIELLGAAGAAWPLASRAQQVNRVRRVGMLLPASADDTIFQVRIGAFEQELALLGWNIGRNVRIEARWATTNAAEIRRQAVELGALAPDVILAAGTSPVVPLTQTTRTVPIVFTHVIDPVGSGIVESLARPGGNATGFTNMEFSLSGKWLELLKEISPGATHAAILRDATQAFATSQFAAIQAVAPSLKMEVKPIDMRDAQGIENSLAAFARSPNGGLVVTASGAGIRYRDLIVSTAARYKLPTVYFDRAIVAAGGLVSYGADLIEQYRLAARYVDRILRGEKPADLPVQAPTKYETVINLKTAKALSLVVPQTLLARADEVIE